MKNLEQLAAECESELKAIGIPFQTVRNWTVNNRAKSRWGLCKKVSEGIYDISISAQLLEDTVDDIATKTTIVHELLHTTPGGHGHRGKWKAYAEKVTCLLPYNITRVTSYEEKGIVDTRKPIDRKYAVHCPKCQLVWRRAKRTKLIKHPHLFHCVLCGSSIQAGEI